MKPEFTIHANVLSKTLESMLADLSAPVSTKTIALRVIGKLMAEHRLGCFEEGDLGAYLVQKVAPTHPCATHDGDVFYRFGRPNVRWRWHPLDQAPSRDERDATEAKSDFEPKTPERPTSGPATSLSDRVTALELEVAELRELVKLAL